MKSTNKILALLLALVLSLGAFASCDIIGISNQTDTYTANITIKFLSNDAKMASAVEAMSSTATLKVNGEDLQLKTSASTGNASVLNNYVYIDGVMYHHTGVTVGEKSAETYKMAPVSQVELDELLSKAGAGADIGIGDFEAQEITETNGNYTYTCTEMNSEAKTSLCDIIGGGLKGIGATVTIQDADYILETENGRNKSYTLTCHLLINMGGTDYEVTMRTKCDYDYSEKVNIFAPVEDIDKYKEVSYEEVLG